LGLFAGLHNIVDIIPAGGIWVKDIEDVNLLFFEGNPKWPAPPCVRRVAARFCSFCRELTVLRSESRRIRRTRRSELTWTRVAMLEIWEVDGISSLVR